MAKGEEKTLKDFGVSVDEIKKSFETIIAGKANLSALKQIFNVAINELSHFPNINNANSYTNYLERWVKSYSDAMTNLPSKRTANPKTSCSDPAVKTLVQYVTKVDDDTAELQSKHHNLFMSAENVQGGLLEEYINSVVSHYGWYWCAGNVMRSIDFCSSDGTLLQVKNKSNTENSSSSAIRSGTPIIKWYRLGTKSVSGKKVPDYKWATLNDIINTHSSIKSDHCFMSEKGYQSFLAATAKNNPNIITKE